MSKTRLFVMFLLFAFVGLFVAGFYSINHVQVEAPIYLKNKILSKRTANIIC
ncbi:hypothetical protein [Lysinibacillus fusiformis]|uniref:hypothetical protein n=1 Tax=Lysinibacillus fusiformis TaxID=28031 RepID=UPI003D02434E